jgi:hypothetical protein
MGSERKRCVAEGRRERTHAWKGNANKGSHSGDANLQHELFSVIKGYLSEASVDVCAILVERGRRTNLNRGEQVAPACELVEPFNYTVYRLATSTHFTSELVLGIEPALRSATSSFKSES